MSGFDAERFDKLVAQHTPKSPPPPFDPAPAGALESLLVHAFLLHDCTAPDADKAFKKLMNAFVDLNELRVARADDIASAIGARYAGAEQRAASLKRTLNDIFNREHVVTLSRLADKNKRDAKQYLASLDGCPPFVAARVLLVGFGGHAVPLDALLLDRLVKARVFEEGAELDRAAATLERHVKAAEALAIHHALENLRETSKPATPARSRAAAGRKA